MITYSDITGKTFDSNDAVYYRNVVQSAWMLSKSDMILLDLFADSNGKLVFCFPIDLHKKYIHEWANRPHPENKTEEQKLVDNNG